jgi:hypothetical protein
MSEKPTNKNDKPTGRPPRHHQRRLRNGLRSLTSVRLDQRSAAARRVKAWKAKLREEAGYEFTVAQETILEEAAQSWLIAGRLAEYLGNQEALVKGGKPDPVIDLHRQASDGVSRNLERLRAAAPSEPIAEILQAIREKAPAPREEKPVSFTGPPLP